MGHGADVTVQELFDRLSERLLAEEGSVERTRMMNAEGLKTGGKFFAMVVDGDLVVKVPAERVAQLVGSGEGRPFESGRRVMKEWVRLRPADAEACEAYVDEARAFVGAAVEA